MGPAITNETKGGGDLWFTSQPGALLDFWAVYSAHYDELTAETMRVAVAHPEFGPVVRDIPPADQVVQNERSREMLRAAIEQGAWEPYDIDLRAQGIIYAQIGISFSGWYDIVGAFQHYIVPLLVDRFGATPSRLKAVLIGLQRFVDHVMVIIAQSYLDSKEQALRASEAHALEANRAKSDFLAMMSHELRTPLNAIIGFSEVLIDGKFGPVNERQARYLRNVNDGGKHLLELINDLLDISKIEAGHLEVVHQACAPRRLAVDAIATLQQLADTKGVTLAVEAVLSQPLPVILADAIRVKQVLYNLLSNAIKFTPAGGRVSVTFSRLPDGELLRTTVSDTGRGIAPHEVERLFKPFSQLDSAKSEPRTGTGLGLAVTKRLVEMMGGRVGVESALGDGSRFFFDLPIKPADVAPIATVDSKGAEAPLILIVDDDAASLELHELTLQGAGYRTIVAMSGEEALALARARRPAAITLDVYLPGIDGWDVLRALRGDAATAEIPVVLVSICVDRRKAMELGAVEHLTKPVNRESLLEVLSRRRAKSTMNGGDVHVLVIDDDVRDRELVRAALEPRGFRVTTASTGRAGVTAALAEPVDLVILDLVLPDMSGVEVAEALRANVHTRGLPILLLTANPLTAADRGCLDGKVKGVLAKSFGIENLVAEIDRIVGDRT